jgi:hypothetical protein
MFSYSVAEQKRLIDDWNNTFFNFSGLKLYEGSVEDGRLKYRFISIAQDLVMAARGKLVERSWKRADGLAATIDDISAFAIPIIAYKEEYAAWYDNTHT